MSKKVLAKQLEQAGIEDISLCECGAYTVTIDEKNYSVHKDNFFEFFPNIEQNVFKKSIRFFLKDSIYCCDHCVNNWGLDLCGCDSGEHFQNCEEGLQECKKPMQSIEEGYFCVKGTGSWV